MYLCAHRGRPLAVSAPRISHRSLPHGGKRRQKNPVTVSYYSKKRRRTQVNCTPLRARDAAAVEKTARMAPSGHGSAVPFRRKTGRRRQKAEHFPPPARTYEYRGNRKYCRRRRCPRLFGCRSCRGALRLYIPPAAIGRKLSNERLFRKLRRQQRLPVDSHSVADPLLLAERDPQRDPGQLLSARHPRGRVLRLQERRIVQHVPFGLRLQGNRIPAPAKRRARGIRRGRFCYAVLFLQERIRILRPRRPFAGTPILRARQPSSRSRLCTATMVFASRICPRPIMSSTSSTG